MNTTSKLPVFLTIHQALAWVLWRSSDAVTASATPSGFSGLKFYGVSPSTGSFDELKKALLEGRIQAIGRTAERSNITIAAEEWLTLRLAPFLSENQYPYLSISVKRAELMRCFPENKDRDQPSRPVSFDWEFVRNLATKEEPMSQHKLAGVLVSLYEEHFAKRIGFSTMKSKLKSWGY